MSNTFNSLIFSSVLIFMVGTISVSAQQVSPAKAGKMCSYDMVVANLSCLNPVAGDDVRLYIMEFQDCKDGHITSLDRMISGHVFSEKNDSYEPNKVDITYSGVRIHFDDRADNLTFELPKAAVIQTPLSKYVVEISGQIVPTFKDADIRYDWSFDGTFKKIDAKGAVLSSGRLICNVSR